MGSKTYKWCWTTSINSWYRLFHRYIHRSLFTESFLSNWRLKYRGGRIMQFWKIKILWLQLTLLKIERLFSFCKYGRVNCLVHKWFQKLYALWPKYLNKHPVYRDQQKSAYPWSRVCYFLYGIWYLYQILSMGEIIHNYNLRKF